MLSARPASLHNESYHVKTPARGTRDRNLLQENLHRVPLTVNAKGKALQTPRRALTVQSHKALSHTAKPTIRVQRPLGDKTPAPNRVANAIPFDTPAPQTAKLAKLSLLEAPQQSVPESLLRPSSARKSLRAPRISSGAQQLDFKTPVTRGDHWNVSDGEIDVGADECVDEIVDVGGEDDDEIEYMPPTAIVPVYEPPFEMPDYTQLGATIRELAHSHRFDDTDDLYHALDANIDVGSQDLWRASGFASAESPSRWEMPKLPPLENELFVRERSDNPKPSLPKAQAPVVMQHKHTSSLPVVRSTSATCSIPVVNSKVPSGRSQPATRAPSRTASTTTTTTRPASSSRSVAHPPNDTHSNNPSTSSRLMSVRPRSKTTSQIARSASVTVPRPEANTRVGTCAPSREATTRPRAVMARSKTTTSVHATTAGLSRATSFAEVAPKQAPARSAAVTVKPTAAISRPVTRAVPTSSSMNATTTRAMSSATTVKVCQKQAQSYAESAPGKRTMVAAAVGPKLAVPDAGDLFHFDDRLASNEDFVFEV